MVLEPRKISDFELQSITNTWTAVGKSPSLSQFLKNCFLGVRAKIRPQFLLSEFGVFRHY